MEARARRIATVGLLLLVATVGVGLALTGGVGVGETITLEATDGPEVDVVTNGGEMLLDGPDGANTVVVTHDNGEIVFTSTGSSQATVDTTEITGSYSHVTGIDATNDLEINPEDKPFVTVGGGIDSVEFRGMAVDDGTRDFSYSAGSTASITVNEIGASSETVIAVASDGTVLDQTTADSSGTATFSSLNSGSHDVTLATTSDPVLSGASPSGGETVTDTPVQLSINVEDADFDRSHGDSVTVEFRDASDDSTIDTDTLTEKGTATVTWSDTTLGENQWYAVATDEYGNEVTSNTHTFNTPHELVIRNESDPDQLLDDLEAEVTVQFFTEGEDKVVERTTTDGTISLEGLEDRQFSVSVQADGFHTRQAIIDSIIEQQTVYLLPESADSHGIRFRLDDQTGQFAEESSQIFIQKPITLDNQTVYRTVSADDFGPGGFTTILESSQRYRILLRNEVGDERTTEPYIPETDETITLDVDQLVFELGGEDTVYQWGFRVDEYEDQPNEVRFTYNDPENLTTNLHVTIHERNNESNVLLEDSFSGPFGSIAITESLPENGSTDWAVQWEADRDGETISGSRFAGERNILNMDMPEGLQHGIAGLALLLVGGLASRVNAATVGVAVGFVGSVFWFIGWLPTVVGGGVIIFALAIPAFYIFAGSSVPGRGI